MSETDLVLLYSRRFERAGFTYMITGSVAGVFYGEPRVTHDVNLVLALKQSYIARIGELFSLEEFYCPPEERVGSRWEHVQRTRAKRVAGHSHDNVTNPGCKSGAPGGRCDLLHV